MGTDKNPTMKLNIKTPKKPSSPAPMKDLALPFPVEIASPLLEKYKRIYDSLNMFWGSTYFDEYVDSLLIDERGGRAGFPHEIIRLIHKVQIAHHESYPHLIVKTVFDDHWGAKVKK